MISDKWFCFKCHELEPPRFACVKEVGDAMTNQDAAQRAIIVKSGVLAEDYAYSVIRGGEEIIADQVSFTGAIDALVDAAVAEALKEREAEIARLKAVMAFQEATVGMLESTKDFIVNRAKDMSTVIQEARREERARVTQVLENLHQREYGAPIGDGCILCDAYYYTFSGPPASAPDCGCPPNWCAASEVSPMAGTCPRRPDSTPEEKK